jgi:hypothetical protein
MGRIFANQMRQEMSLALGHFAPQFSLVASSPNVQMTVTPTLSHRTRRAVAPPAVLAHRRGRSQRVGEGASFNALDPNQRWGFISHVIRRPLSRPTGLRRAEAASSAQAGEGQGEGCFRLSTLDSRLWVRLQHVVNFQ